MDKTAFVYHRGLFEHTVMPFGLCNASATFQRTMNAVLSGLEHRIVCVYVDDIIVYSKTFGKHIEDLEEVFARLDEVGLSLKATKCRFARGSPA